MIARKPIPKTSLGTIIVVDTIEKLTREDCVRLVALGVDARGGYVDSVTPEELADHMAAGLGFFPIGYAHEHHGLAAKCTALGIPPGVHVTQDVEAETGPADALISLINTCTASLIAAHLASMGYFGAQQLLTSTELTALAVNRYWKGCSRVLDRFGNVAEPARGYCMNQERPPNRVIVNGKKFDVSSVGADYHDDLPVFCYAS